MVEGQPGCGMHRRQMWNMEGRSRCVPGNDGFRVPGTLTSARGLLAKTDLTGRKEMSEVPVLETHFPGLNLLSRGEGERHLRSWRLIAHRCNRPHLRVRRGDADARSRQGKDSDAAVGVLAELREGYSGNPHGRNGRGEVPCPMPAFHGSACRPQYVGQKSQSASHRMYREGIPGRLRLEGLLPDRGRLRHSPAGRAAGSRKASRTHFHSFDESGNGRARSKHSLRGNGEEGGQGSCRSGESRKHRDL